MADTPSERELCERYASLYPGAVTDVLDEMGHLDQTMDPSIAPLDREMTTAGIAYPVVGRPNDDLDPDENIRNIVTMFSDVPENAVLTYQTDDDVAAHIGELSVTALKEAGCRGAVVDGGARDVDYILNRDLPVFARYNTPADAVPRWEILDWDVTATVGGIEVSPGDVVLGDVDGVVVIPREVAVDVLEAAERVVNTENEVRAAVLDGVTPLDAYEEHGKF